MKIVIAGGRGFIGNKLTNILIQQGHEIIVLTRSGKSLFPNVEYVTWLNGTSNLEEKLENTDVYINLAGVSINDGRWTKKHQKEIYQSRMEATEELLRIIKLLPQKPATLINASAVGIYPSSFDAIYTEKSPDRSNDFLAKTVIDWEKKAKEAEQFGIRTVFMRFGVVLGNDGGALPLMTLPYKLFAGGTVGSGKQWVSWIHVIDAVRAIVFVMENERVRRPVNVVAPNPVKMEELGRTIGFVLRRPHWFPAPSFLLKLVLGEKSKLVLEGQKVLPSVLLDEGFEFEFPTVEKALKDLLVKK
ncbi:TIGR01777 family oxidoreductase [Caldifermentibacillus hisashii]|uniref:TIGR01777 family oxidoreductase n=1 Tax=Caldifermentibacillus hisashii TaxID=996558 RepID=UPI0030E959DD